MCYFADALNDKRTQTVDECLEVLRPRLNEFDAIAFTGISGAVMAPILAYLLDKPLIAVRKSIDDGTHSCDLVETSWVPDKLNDEDRVLVVDDFVLTGSTLHRIIEALRSDCSARVVAVLGYQKYAGGNKRHAPWADTNDSIKGIELWQHGHDDQII